MKLRPTKAYAVYWQYKGKYGFIDVYKDKGKAELMRELLAENLPKGSHIVVPVKIMPSLKRG